MNKLVEKTKIFYKSDDLTELSKTATRISSHAKFRDWQVTDIEESGEVYCFTVTGDYEDDYLREETKMKNLLSSDVVKMEYKTPKEDDLISQAIWAISESEDVDGILNKLMDINEQEDMQSGTSEQSSSLMNLLIGNSNDLNNILDGISDGAELDQTLLGQTVEALQKLLDKINSL